MAGDKLSSKKNYRLGQYIKGGRVQERDDQRNIEGKKEENVTGMGPKEGKKKGKEDNVKKYPPPQNTEEIRSKIGKDERRIQQRVEAKINVSSCQLRLQMFEFLLH